MQTSVLGVSNSNEKLQVTSMQASNDASHTKMQSQLDTRPDRKYYFDLLKLEPAIDWHEFAANIFKRTHAIGTVTVYCQHIANFRQFLQANTSTRYKARTIAEAIAEIKAQTASTVEGKPQGNGIAYHLLNDFGTYLDSQRGFMPRTTRDCINAVRKLFTFCDIELNSQTFKSKVTLPKPKQMREEYPPNDEIKKILNAQNQKMRTLLLAMIDAGFEPIDILQLKPKHFKFDETPVRVRFDREKTQEPVETFVSADTSAQIQALIKVANKGQDDYLFIEAKTFSESFVKTMRNSYNNAVARAGFGEIVRYRTSKTQSNYARVQKIDGHKFGRYHLKIYKKRWFSIAQTVAPIYIVQGMLGRHEYLDEYNAQPLSVKQEYAKKILKAVNIYADKDNAEQVQQEVAKVLGLENLTKEQLQQLRGILQAAMKLPVPRAAELLSNG